MVGSFLQKVAFLFLATAGLSACLDYFRYPPPESGIYKDRAGLEFKVSSTGPSALSIVRGDEVCLMFWRYKNRKISNGKETLAGQECSNRTFGDLDWSVVYDYNAPNVINVYGLGKNSEKWELKLAQER